MVSVEQSSKMEHDFGNVPTIEVHPPEDEVPEAAGHEEGHESLRKKVRHRKNALYAAILKQMEFYFSDSNLTKDRFLAELVNQDPDVDIDEFLKFNKIRSLTTDVKMIAKALKNSSMLKVSEDGTKVRRITPVVVKENVDDCTVYVQRLPPDANHEWLRTEFSKYGKVTYVSIPKFRITNKIKGFAFVEFETPKDVQKCLKDFKARGCVLPSQTGYDDVLSITTYEEEAKQEQSNLNEQPKEDVDKSFESDSSKHKKKKKKKNRQSFEELESESDTKANTKEDSSAKKEDKKRKKKKHDDVEDSETDQSDSSKPKKMKCVDKESDDHSADLKVEKENESRKKKKHEEIEDSETEGEVKCKKIKTEESEVTTAESDINDDEKAENGKGVSRKKKRKRIRVSKAHTMVEHPFMGMQVMAKQDWKRLRNKYLNLQRSKMKELKQHLRRVNWYQWGDKNKMEDEAEELKKANSARNLEFVPGLIVKVNLNEPCIDPKSFKSEMKSNNSNIKYVDVKESSNVAYVRFDSAEAATGLAEKTTAEKQFEVLSGEEEVKYWEQIKADREEKCSNNVRPKVKGRKKLLKKCEKVLGKHIKFDD